MSDTLHLALLFVLLALLLVGVMEVRRRFGWAWAGLAAVGACILLVVASSIPMCACGKDSRVTQAQVRATLDHIRLAEEARFRAGGRYVPLDSLDYGDTYATRATLTVLADSGYRVDGASLDDPTIGCTFTMIRGRRPDPTITCHGTQ